MKRAAKRGKSLEERLSAVRASSEDVRPAPMDPVAPSAGPTSAADAPSAGPLAAPVFTAFAATEGDTFLPAGAVDPVGLADVTRAQLSAARPASAAPAQELSVTGGTPRVAVHVGYADAVELGPPLTVEPVVTREAEPSPVSSALVDNWSRPFRKRRNAMVLEEPAAVPDEPAPLPDEPAALLAVLEQGTVVAPEEPKPLAPRDRREVVPRAFGRVGAAMIERGLITGEQLDQALEMQRNSGGRVGEILVALGALSSFELARVLADHIGVPFTDLRSKPPDPILATFLPEEVARRYDALAIARWNDQLVIAMANPTDLFALDDLQMVAREPVIAAMAVKEDLRAAIDRAYRGSIVETSLDAAASDYRVPDAFAARAVDEVNEGPIVGLVSALMGQAITDHASDLHIEPCSTHVAVRFRIDGVLHDSSEVPLELLRPLVSRLKIMAGLDIAQNRVAQDGRFSLTIQGRSVDVRAVTMPTAAGESVILRLLDPVRDTLGVSSLGLGPVEHARFVPAFRGSQGAVFIVGPTGSGKTSTVYAALSEINTRSKSIISVEDPVEYRLDGVKQIQINPRIGLTFPSTLPTVLRADPDIVFIGEVRDTETARIAADASITGHLVLSTLHATHAAAAPMRLIEMGVEPYLVASALTLVASQRLARKLCEECAEPAGRFGLAHLRDLGAGEHLLVDVAMRRAVGCPACRNTGYRGRQPIFEIMPVTESISRLILDRAPRAEIERLAVEEGMETLHQAALRRVIRGDLSIEEMLRVTS